MLLIFNLFLLQPCRGHLCGTFYVDIVIVVIYHVPIFLKVGGKSGESKSVRWMIHTAGYAAVAEVVDQTAVTEVLPEVDSLMRSED